jgi:hypothetical protein
MGTYIMATVGTAADEPDRAWAELQDVMSRWSQRGFHVQHHNELIASALIRLYQGDGLAAWEHARAREPLYRRVMLWRVQHIRIDVRQLWARSALAAAGRAADPIQPARARGAGGVLTYGPAGVGTPAGSSQGPASQRLPDPIAQMVEAAAGLFPPAA